MRKKLSALKCAVIAGAVAVAGVASCIVGTLAGNDSSGDVAINETNFPDSNFRGFVSRVYDENNDGILNSTEIEKATMMNCDGYSLSASEKYTDLTGIKYFVNLESLSCINNNIKEIDVSGLTKLENFAFDGNPLTSLDVSGCTSLGGLRYGHKALTSLDVSGCTSLEYLYCYGNALTNLDVSGCSSLNTLSCETNALTSLDVSGCTSLRDLYCYTNALTSLDVSGCTSLRFLDCHKNALTKLDVSDCTSLISIDYGYNMIPYEITVPDGCYLVSNDCNLKDISGNFSDGVTITWCGQNPYNQDYIIYRKSGDGAFEEVGKVGSTETAFTDKNVKEGCTYTYAVGYGRDYNSIGLWIFLKPADKTPYLENTEGKTGWDAIAEVVKNAEAGSDVPVDMNGADKVSGAVIDSIKGKDVTVVLNLGNGISWSINGKNVVSDKSEDIDMTVSTGVDAVPADLVKTVAADSKTVQLSLSHDGKFGFDAVLSVPMDKEDAGLYANLFYYNKTTGKLEFMDAVKIADDGSASFTFKHASDYVIVIDKNILGKTEEETETSKPAEETKPSTGATETDTTGSAANNDIPATGDTGSAMLIVLIGAAVVAAFAGVYFTQKKKADEA